MCLSHLCAFLAALCKDDNLIRDVWSEKDGTRKKSFETSFLSLGNTTPFPRAWEPSISPLFSDTCLSPLLEDIRSFVLCLCLGNGCVDVTCFGSSERNRFISFYSRRQLGNSLPSKYNCSPSLCHPMNQRRGHKSFTVSRDRKAHIIPFSHSVAEHSRDY